MTVPSNGPKTKVEIETEAIEKATAANAALAKARKEAEEAEKEVHSLRPLDKNAHVPQVNSVDGERPFPGITSDPSDSSCDSCTTKLAIVSVIVAALIFLWLALLTFGKASNEQIDAVQKTATEASATAKTAAKNAEDAKAGMAEVAGLKSQLTALKKDMATVAANADTANAKADAANSKADNAMSAMKKAQVASKTHHTHPRHETSPNAGRHQDTPRAASQASTNPVGEKTCKVLGTKGEILADFLDATKNPKKIVVTSGAECKKERDAFALATGFPTVKREVHSIGN